MIAINLLPWREASRLREKILLKRIFLVGVFICLLSAGIVHFRLSRALQTLQFAHASLTKTEVFYSSDSDPEAALHAIQLQQNAVIRLILALHKNHHIHWQALTKLTKSIVITGQADQFQTLAYFIKQYPSAHFKIIHIKPLAFGLAFQLEMKVEA